MSNKGIIETPKQVFLHGPFTRYEIAVIVARFVDKFGYDPNFAPGSGIDRSDAFWVKDILVALLFEYRDEFMFLGVTDPMTSGYWEIQAYQRATEKHRVLNASDWYSYAENQPWKKEIIVPLPRGKRFAIVPPPRLTITPSILHFARDAGYLPNKITSK